MNGEVPNVPITTLAGVTSLTELLPELPLPTPLQNAINSRSLLYNGDLSELSRTLLDDPDDTLVDNIASILRRNTSDHIEPKDNLVGAPIDGEMSELLRAILANDPDVFYAGSSRQTSGSHSGHSSGTRAEHKKPVVMLEPLDAKFSLLDAIPKKDDIWNSCKQLSVSLKPLDAQTLKSIASNGTVKTKRSKRGYDDGEHVRKKRRSGYQDDNEDDDDDDSGHGTAEDLMRRKKQEKRQRRMNQSDMTTEELLDSPTFKKFSMCLEQILDSAEEINFGSFDPHDEEVECPPESLISRHILAELTSETAKLKSMGELNKIPAGTLVKLLTILQWNIRDGTKLVPFMSQETDDEDEEGQKLWREIAMERVGRSVDAALTAIYIITSPNMPKQVFIEDVIDRIVMFTKFQLSNTIYPEFDPVYRINPKDKDGYQKSLKMKRSRAHAVKHKSTISLYNKITDLVGNIAELVEIQELTDTLILQISTCGVAPFFVENISELQLNAMKLVTTVFAHYDKHRQLILEDIFSSLARLPSSKRNLRSYRLNAEDNIQMVTALVLQLIQCVVNLPQSAPTVVDGMPAEEEAAEASRHSKADKSGKGKRRSAEVLDRDVVIITSYEHAMRTGYNFLSVFLKKCTLKGEEDYRPLFENFVQDLLSTVNKPEWPASELLLSLLGKILIKQFSNKSTEMGLRTAALDYLSIVVARLRRDAVSSHLNPEMLQDIITKVNEETAEDNNVATKRSTRAAPKTPETETGELDETKCLQRAMLNYLAEQGVSEPAYLFARQFYIAQWFRDTTKEAEKQHQRDDEADFVAENEDKATENMVDITARKQFLLLQVEINYKPYSSFKPLPSKLDYDSACLVARYLSSKRPFAQSFDVYLGQILKVLAENAVAVRTKAMKCLTSIVEADPGVLARTDMERGVHGRFLDPSTSVREAAVELVGKFILVRPELIPQYYHMLSERILDTGISVRKRVIKIFRDIFSVQPDFPKIPEMCVKMIRRVNDEDGIKKLVNEVFQTIWFSPISGRDKDSAKLIQRVVHITDVVAACKDTGFEFIEQLLDNLLKKDEHGNYNKSAVTSCRQIVDCLVENVLRLEETSVDGKCSTRLTGCLTTLYLFTKIKPDLMLDHAHTLQPYLNIKCNSQSDLFVLSYVAKILQLVIPLMDHPAESFLAQVEEDMIKLILNYGMMVLESCVSCLGAVVNNVSHNYLLVRDCFQKFYGFLLKYQSFLQDNPTVAIDPVKKPTLLRSLYTVGLMCKHFNFDMPELSGDNSSMKETIFDLLIFFTTHEDDSVQLMAMTGIGFMAVRHFEYMLGRTLKTMYCDLMVDINASHKMKCQVLKNLFLYLQEEEVRMAKSDAEWKKHAKEEDLKEMGDVQSGMASTIMQVYLKEVLESFFHSKSQVRLEALNVIQLVLNQGLVHPVQCIPYLISVATDTLPAIRIKAEQLMQEIDKKYPGFIHMKALQGIKMCFKLQEIIQADSSDGVVRGLHNPHDNSSSLNAFLYGVLRANRSHRRALLTSLLNLLDDSAKISLQEQLYIVDNLAFFLYQTQDEPLFIIHHIDILVSVSGSNLLQSFREKLIGDSKTATKMMLSPPNFSENGLSENQRHAAYDDDDDDKDTLIDRLPEDISPLKEIIWIAQGCILLLYLKQHLKDMYGFTDSKIQNYSPTEAAKVYDKPLPKKALVKFNPEAVLSVIREKGSGEEKTFEEECDKLVDDYLNFKDLMLSVDPPDEDDSEDNANKPVANTTTYIIKQKEAEGGDTMVNGENGDESKTSIDVIDQDGDAGSMDKESSEENLKPRIPPMIISAAKLQTAIREKDKKKGSLVRTFRLPGASQLQESAHSNKSASSHNITQTPNSHHNAARSRHRSSSSHGSLHTPSHASVHTPSSHKKQKKKKRKRYGSDSDDEDDSDYDPYS